MRTRLPLPYAVGLFLLVSIGAAVAALWNGRHLSKAQAIEDYRRAGAQFRNEASSYRRPVVVGEPIEGNAAVWYRQSLAHVDSAAVKRLAQLEEAIRGGFTEYSKTATAEIDHVCIEAQSPRIREALRR